MIPIGPTSGHHIQQILEAVNHDHDYLPHGPVPAQLPIPQQEFLISENSQLQCLVREACDEKEYWRKKCQEQTREIGKKDQLTKTLQEEKTKLIEINQTAEQMILHLRNDYFRKEQQNQLQAANRSSQDCLLPAQKLQNYGLNIRKTTVQVQENLMEPSAKRLIDSQRWIPKVQGLGADSFSGIESQLHNRQSQDSSSPASNPPRGSGIGIQNADPKSILQELLMQPPKMGFTNVAAEFQFWKSKFGTPRAEPLLKHESLSSSSSSTSTSTSTASSPALQNVCSPGSPAEIPRSQVDSPEDLIVADQDVAQVPKTIFEPAAASQDSDSFAKAVELWKSKYQKWEETKFKGLDMSPYLFSPSIKDIVPQTKKIAPTSMVFYCHFNQAFEINSVWKTLPAQEKYTWKEKWELMRRTQNEQLNDGLIVPKTKKRKLEEDSK